MIRTLSFVLLFSSAASAGMTVARLPIPGTPDFVRVAKDVLDVRFAMDPSMASGAGLFDDSARVPSFAAPSIGALHARLQSDIDALRAMPWRRWPVDAQIDFRWIYANARAADHILLSEKPYLHRPGAWLEPLANNFIALLTYAPERSDLREKIFPLIPPMVTEIRATASPTERDVTTSLGLIDGLLKMLAAEKASPARDAAAASLSAYANELKALKNLPEFSVVGADNYAWIVKNEELLPWTPSQLLAQAQSELELVDARMAELKPHLTPEPKPTPEQAELAKSLTREKLLGLYDQIVKDDRAALEKSGVLTVPRGVGPIHARETPDAMVPLTGDGGSMNPPPTYVKSNVGYWNVEHFHADWSQDRRLEAVMGALNQRVNGMGPYAAHEGVPGHHLQLSIARLIKDPIRSVLADGVQNEGWALYAEDMFQRAGGLGASVDAQYQTLDSWRFRVRRVIYDVNVESGLWSLQQAGDFKSSASEPGKGTVDEDVLRAVNWPAQLICYFSGKTQIVRLREDYKKKMGKDYTDRDFHDKLLAVGSVPFVFARAKLLGEPVPDLD
ncbi:MAG: DUF885 family protein [Elusimicrobiota bacterium]